MWDFWSPSQGQQKSSTDSKQAFKEPLSQSHRDELQFRATQPRPSDRAFGIAHEG